MDPRPSLSESRCSGTRSAPTAPRGVWRSGGPDASESTYPRYISNTDANGRTKRPRQEDLDETIPEKNVQTNGSASNHAADGNDGRAKRRGKEKEKPSSSTDHLIESPTSKLSTSATVGTVKPHKNDAEEQPEDITRCMRGLSEFYAERGEFIIQCDACNVWQHGLCMGFESEVQLDEAADYYCEQCKPERHYELFMRLARQARESSTSRLVSPEELPPPPNERSAGSDKLSAETKSGLSSFPTPPDLTRDIIRIDDQFSEVGGFGDVHKCKYNSASGAQEVAVKAFRFIFTLEERGTKVAKMVRRELGIWKRLDHPNIVPFLGIATGFGLKGSTSIVSLWMSNGSLRQFLGSHGDKLGVAHRLQMLSDVANGLDYLHSFSNTPVIHGDLNCNNVLVDANFTARLADFGLSSFVGNIPQGWTYLGGSTTRPGTLRWTAPEQLEDGYERVPQSDIYSFGCISLQVFSGQPPWSEVREDAAVVLRLAKGQNPQRPISRAMEDCHWEFTESCWTSVEERPTAKMLVSFLQELLISCPPSRPLSEIFAPLSSPVDPIPLSGVALGQTFS